MADGYGPGRKAMRPRLPCTKLGECPLPRGIRRLEEREIDALRRRFARKGPAAIQPGAVGFFFNQRDWLFFGAMAFLFLFVSMVPITKVVDHGLAGLFMINPTVEKILLGAYVVLVYLMLLSLKRRIWLVIDDAHLFFRKRGALFESYEVIAIASISQIEFGRPFGLGSPSKRHYRTIFTVNGSSYTTISSDRLQAPTFPLFLAEVVSDATGLPLIMKRVHESYTSDAENVPGTQEA